MPQSASPQEVATTITTLEKTADMLCWQKQSRLLRDTLGVPWDFQPWTKRLDVELLGVGKPK